MDSIRGIRPKYLLILRVAGNFYFSMNEYILAALNVLESQKSLLQVMPLLHVAASCVANIGAALSLGRSTNGRVPENALIFGRQRQLSFFARGGASSLLKNLSHCQIEIKEN
jgi:hypothetical protein